MRKEGRLEDEALVVRGGNVTGEKLRKGCDDFQGTHGFSVQCATGRTVAELAAAGKLPNRVLGVSTVGELRAAGYDVVRTGSGLHATVVVPPDWTEDAANALTTAFRSQPNPVRR